MRGRKDGDGAEFGRHGGAAERGRQVERTAFAGLAEAPERRHHAQQKCGQQILHEQRAGDQLHDRRGGEEGDQQPGDAGRNPAAHGRVEQAEQHEENREVEQARGHLAAQQVDDRVGEIRAHRHDRPEIPGRVERQQVIGCDVGGNRQVHGETVRAGLRFEHGEPVSDQDEEERRAAQTFAPGAQLNGGGQTQAGGSSRGRDEIRQDRERQDTARRPTDNSPAGARRTA